MFLLSCYRLFASISKDDFSTSGPTLNSQLCCTFALSSMFLLPLSYSSMLSPIAVDDGALLDATSLTIPQLCRPIHWAWRGSGNISMVFLDPLTRPLDIKKLHSFAMVLYEERHVVWIEESRAESKSFELFCLGINMVEITYLIQPGPQWKSESGCLLLPMQSSWQSSQDVVRDFLHDNLVHGKLCLNMQRLILVVHLYEGSKRWRIPILYIDKYLHYCLWHARWILL